MGAVGVGRRRELEESPDGARLRPPRISFGSLGWLGEEIRRDPEPFDLLVTAADRQTGRALCSARERFPSSVERS